MRRTPSSSVAGIHVVPLKPPSSAANQSRTANAASEGTRPGLRATSAAARSRLTGSLRVADVGDARFWLVS